MRMTRGRSTPSARSSACRPTRAATSSSRRPLLAGRARGARRGSPARPRRGTWLSRSARRWRVDGALYNCAVTLHGGRVLAVAPKAHLAELSRVLRAALVPARGAARVDTIVPARRDRARSAPTCSSTCRTSTASCCTSRSARTSGRRCRRARSPRSRARPCSRTCRRRTSPSASSSIAATWSACRPRRTWRCSSTAPPASASRRPTWRGTATGSSRIAASWWRRRERFALARLARRRRRRSRGARAPTGCGRPRSARTPPAMRAAVRRVASRARARPPAGDDLARPPSATSSRCRSCRPIPRSATQRCREIFLIKATALAQRLQSLPPDARHVVIGVSGGRDSTQALLVAVHAMDLLKRPRRRRRRRHDAGLRDVGADVRGRVRARPRARRDAARDRHPRDRAGDRSRRSATTTPSRT